MFCGMRRAFVDCGGVLLRGCLSAVFCPLETPTDGERTEMLVWCELQGYNGVSWYQTIADGTRVASRSMV